MSIHDSVEKIKGWTKGDEWQDVVIVIIVLFVGIGSFFLGRWSKMDSKIDTNSASLGNLQLPIKPTETATQAQSVTGNFVASKNGTKYYPLGCSGIDRIKEENKIYFENETEAAASGRTKSSTCK